MQLYTKRIFIDLFLKNKFPIDLAFIGLTLVKYRVSCRWLLLYQFLLGRRRKHDIIIYHAKGIKAERNILSD